MPLLNNLNMPEGKAVGHIEGTGDASALTCKAGHAPFRTFHVLMCHSLKMHASVSGSHSPISCLHPQPPRLAVCIISGHGNDVCYRGACPGKALLCCSLPVDYISCMLLRSTLPEGSAFCSALIVYTGICSAVLA